MTKIGVTIEHNKFLGHDNS